ncbi:DUF443 family protein [Candidatus Enterococcus mangumiae]|uniref:DUF443 family protein n=1 Tax=Candidatus Enterococcus mangumiae TaxID=2230878 RepID=A0ABZ2ST23_9ENTE|nr:DUF443 family protein [Enterococcus sp. DIV1094]MBO0490929.1 DUF443 family protein [Enterococcus sp. DIV1094]
MISEIKNIIHNDRYKVLITEENEFYLIDADSQLKTLLFAPLGWLGKYEGVKITQRDYDDLIVQKVNEKNSNNSSFLYTLILFLFVLFLRMFIPEDSKYSMITFLIILLGALFIKFYLSYREKQLLHKKIFLETYEKVKIRVVPLIRVDRLLKMILINLLLDGTSIAFSLLYIKRFNLLYMPFLIINFIFLLLLIGRAALTEQKYKVSFN